MGYISKKEMDRKFESLEKARYKCKCGHTVIINKKDDKVLCSWCGHYVYKDKKIEFMEKMKVKMKRG